MSLWGAVLGHGNLVYHAAGWQEGGLTASFEKLVLDVEMLQLMVEFLRPIVVDEAELGFEAIKGVPTGGHFFGAAHTMARYEHAFYQPLVSNWQNYENWQASGGKDATQRAFDSADVVVEQDIYIPRIHVASIETCGCVAKFDKTAGKLTVWMTTQAPHAIRTVFSLVSKIPEHKIRVISPDIGGGFGGKVPVYPGYVIAVAASVVIGKPVKWVEDRMENLQADSFARDYHIHA